MSVYPGMFVKPCIAPTEIQEGDFVAFLDGQARSGVARHLALCPACAAEVAALQQVEFVLSRALQPTSQSGQKTKANRHPARSWFFLPGSALGRVGAVLAMTLIVFGLVGGLTYDYRSNHNASVAIEPAHLAETPLLPVAETVAVQVDSGILVEATVPDVDKRVISQYEPTRLPSAEANVATLSGIAGESASFSGADRHAITQIIDVNIAARLVDEKLAEIAPPLELRRMLEQQLQEKPDEFLLRIEAYKSKSLVIGQAGMQYLVWVDNRNGVTNLYAAHSTDDGATWSEDVKVDKRVGRVFQPALVVDENGQLYLIWRNWSNIHSSAFYFSHSIDGGQSWNRALRIDNTSGKTVKPDLAVDSSNGHLYLTWGSRRNANTDIYFIHSPDLGQTWSSKVRMANIGS